MPEEIDSSLPQPERSVRARNKYRGRGGRRPIFLAPRLSLLQRIKLNLFGHVNISNGLVNGWKGRTRLLAIKCKDHGVVVGMLLGSERQVRCPLCNE
ncbi:hypothetical protein E3J39_03495 [Candidatus Bathyarchaeota archaeon]|nr:MAG: hypothetical protein E3J39_03495 [Candidatus Bathyarchaeota archaeon]